jgi:hypothetical protein
VIYPQTQEVDVYRSARKSETLMGKQKLDGGEVVSGFSFSVAMLFE